MDHSPLIRALIERQGDHADREFAARLGIPKTTWQWIRSGNWPGRRALASILRAYPELASELLADLREEVA